MVPNAEAEPWGPHQLLSMAARLIQRRQDQALADLGLTHAAVIALQGLAAGPLNQERLAAEIKVRSQSLGRVLARLEAAGLVTRTSSSRDRRSNDVAITDAGIDALAAAREVEKDALPPNLADGTVLSRELARVISYFPGPHRARAVRREDAETPGTEDAGTDVPDAENPGTEDAGTETPTGGAPFPAEPPVDTTPEPVDVAGASRNGAEAGTPGHPDGSRAGGSRPEGSRED